MTMTTTLREKRKVALVLLTSKAILRDVNSQDRSFKTRETEETFQMQVIALS